MSIIKSIKQVLGLGPAAESHHWDGSVPNQLTLKRGTPDAPGSLVASIVNGIMRLTGGTTAPTTGQVGEILTVVGGPVDVISGNVTGFGDFTLSPGVWDIQTEMYLLPSDAGCFLQHVTASLNAGQLGDLSNKLQAVIIEQGFTSNISSPLSRLVVTTPTQVFCVGRVNFSTGTVNASTVMTARRVA